MIFYFVLMITVCYARNPFPDATDDNFQNEALSVTNSYRSGHHANGLHIDGDLVNYAKSRCQLISQYEGLSHGHAGLQQGYGENLYWGGSSEQGLAPAKAAIDDWYDEEEDYSYDDPGFSSDTGHFTQLVWKNTNAVGCARCGGKGSQWYETYIVCNYSPPGNYLGQFPENVQAP